MSFRVELYNEAGQHIRLTVPNDDDLAGVIDATRKRLGIELDPVLEQAETARWNALQAKWNKK
ncbi:MAG: hypothetical protein ING91_19375 [Rhodocyclaceae bacterium]|nr:hypothetical protein [Rhodocyclaceae bacterium]MCA3116396.1 hypothetical protein [Rhodocyclaceae bacterium]MCA3127071.1 hypothetical protein [Rhodocyclaceae bacterium]